MSYFGNDRLTALLSKPGKEAKHMEKPEHDSMVARLKECFPLAGAVPTEYRIDARAYERNYLDGGRLKQWEGPVVEVSSPVCFRDGQTLQRTAIGCMPVMDEATVMAQLGSAVRAWDNGRGKWPTMPVAGRIEAVESFVSMMRAAREEVVKLLMWEIGKSLEESRKEFDRTVEYITRTIEALKENDRTNSRFTLDGGVIAQVRRAPLGVVLSMGPFNYPLNETYTTLIPAILMGNTAVVKPPKFGGLCHQPLLRAFAESFPPGVVNFIYGKGANIVSPIMASGNIDVLAFIGSSRVADTLKHQHPRPHRMRGILGLDAKNPALVMADADLELAVKECLTGTLSFNGQRCTALKILFVHESVQDAFLDKFCAGISALPAGMPWEKDVKLTPLPEYGKAEAMQALVDDALAKGARVVNASGGVSCATLYWPAVACGISPAADLYRREQFGPVVPVCTYREEHEFLDFVANSSYGQQVSLFGQDPRRIAALLDPLANQVCRINLNSQCQRGPDTLPFTGRKDSAEATLSISDALRCFSIRSLVAVQSTQQSRTMIQQIVAGRLSSFLNTDFIL